MELSTDEKGGWSKLADPLLYKKLKDDLMVLIQHRVLKTVTNE
jgi:hypothetical protein